jgi:prepilin signal peptidase PulO-like enzyme (type II secretory pathway)
LKNEWGNGIHCRKCSAEVRYSPPYPVIFLFGSAPILVAALAVRGVEEGFVASIKMVLAWFLGSICAAVFFSWIKPPKLKLANDGDEDPYPTPSIFK